MPTKTTTRRARAPRKVKAPTEIVYPSAEAIEEARHRRKTTQVAQGITPGTVLGLSDEWVGAVMDPDLPDGAKARTAESWRSKGWVELEGLHTVAGYHNGAIVYVKKREDYNKARTERAARIAAAQRAGRMHKGA